MNLLPHRIFPLPADLYAQFILSLRDAMDSSCLLARDGGDESALT